MTVAKMHADEVDIDAALVSRLVAAQFPRWADLPIMPVLSAGTDNANYRLGDDMVVRLPRIPGAVAQIEKEQRWLPRLAPLLPLSIPVPLGWGKPAQDYPWDWSIYRWLPGETVSGDDLIGGVVDGHRLATDLAGFITALHGIDTGGQERAGLLASYRGEPLGLRDEATRTAIAACEGMVDIGRVTVAWDAALAVPRWDDPPVWVHGDFQPGNLLVERGRLSAVIDFGGLTIGDPAVDLIVAWNLLSAEMRETFREAIGVDDATWARGRGWALSIGLVALPYYVDTNPVLAAISRYQIGEVLADHARGD
ncbi:MAG: aminoglycoside phosphotransferase family protein [Chloroflexota bacterium]|nr:aminoglycoside phosphotransferase family protein [Chloroflexota bacterium]